MADAKIVSRLRLDVSDFLKGLNLSEEQMKRATAQLERAAQAGQKEWDRMARRAKGGGLLGVLKGITPAMAGWGAVVSGATAAMRDAVQTTTEFERSLSGLSALTGATGDDLEFIRRTAIELSRTSELSAKDVVEAMKMIGGQRAELLDSADGLAAVTRAAITLAEASEGSVQDAAKALTGAMGQFGAGVEYAASYVNVLAAGAKEGAAEIPYLQQAIEKSGSAASSAGLSFEQLVAVIEGVAPRFTKAEEAGTSLRAVFTILESQTNDKLRPSIVGIHEALDNLAAEEMSTAELTKLFGRENINMARALMDARGNIRELETAVTGTKVAEEQAAVVTDNLQGATTELANAWDAFVLSLNRSDGLLADAVRSVTNLLNVVNDLFQTLDSRRQARADKATSEETQRAYDELVRLQSKGMSREDAIAQTLRTYRVWAEQSRQHLRGLDKELDRIAKKRKAYAGLNAWEALTNPDMALTGDELAVQNYNPRSDVFRGASNHFRRDYRKQFLGAASRLGIANAAGLEEDVRFLDSWAQVEKTLTQMLAEERGKRREQEGADNKTAERERDAAATDAGKAAARRAQRAREHAAKEAEKTAREREAAQKQLGERLTEVQADVEQGQVDALAEGYEKQRARIRLEWRRTLEEIDRQQREAEELARKAGLGGLTAEQAGAYDRRREQATTASMAATAVVDAEEKRRAEASVTAWAEAQQEITENAIQAQRERTEAMWQGVQTGLSGVSGLLGVIDQEWARTAANFISTGMQIVQSVLSIVQAVQAMQAAIQAAKVASAVGSMFGPFGLGFGLLSPFFARGGVVDGYAAGGRIRGGRTTGDHVLARVNAGEMVLTRTDQSRLLSDMRAGGGGELTSVTVRGEEMYMALSAYMKRTGRRFN